jgi:hypothetical protein
VPGAPKQVSDPNGAFAFQVPADWVVVPQPGCVGVADPTRQHASVVVDAAPRQAQSLEQFAQQMVARWQQGTPGWQLLATQQVQVAGCPGFRFQANACPAGTVLSFDFLLVLTAQRQIIITSACPQTEVAQWQGTFAQIIQSIQLR